VLSTTSFETGQPLGLGPLALKPLPLLKVLWRITISFVGSWAEIQQLALIGSSSSLHSEACNALGASDGVIHSKNPKIIHNNDKVLRYVQMIRDENKRMHSQVENVLRISRLEKNEIEISKETVDLHDIIEDAISRIGLLIADNQGRLDLHFEAITAEIPGNQFHLTNVIVNILENALKYSEGAPKIDVYTESTNKFFVFKIKDEGIGMSKAVQKLVFNKFYREQKGNIHDVKGHGLGLAYVKEIVEKHHGTVFVESEKGVGSLFTVKLPLI